MNDTSPQIEQIVRQRVDRLSGAERVAMGADMLETARAMVLASFPPGLSDREIKYRLCQRFYGTNLADHVYGSPTS